MTAFFTFLQEQSQQIFSQTLQHLYLTLVALLLAILLGVALGIFLTQSPRFPSSRKVRPIPFFPGNGGIGGSSAEGMLQSSFAGELDGSEDDVGRVDGAENEFCWGAATSS